MYLANDVGIYPIDIMFTNEIPHTRRETLQTILIYLLMWAYLKLGTQNIPPKMVWLDFRSTQCLLEKRTHKTHTSLVSGFNPCEKHASKWESSPSGEPARYIKPSCFMIKFSTILAGYRNNSSFLWRASKSLVILAGLLWRV